MIASASEAPDELIRRLNNITAAVPSFESIPEWVDQLGKAVEEAKEASKGILDYLQQIQPPTADFIDQWLREHTLPSSSRTSQCRNAAGHWKELQAHNWIRPHQFVACFGLEKVTSRDFLKGLTALSHRTSLQHVIARLYHFRSARFGAYKLRASNRPRWTADDVVKTLNHFFGPDIVTTSLATIRLDSYRQTDLSRSRAQGGAEQASVDLEDLEAQRAAQREGQQEEQQREYEQQGEQLGEQLGEQGEEQQEAQEGAVQEELDTWPSRSRIRPDNEGDDLEDGDDRDEPEDNSSIGQDEHENNSHSRYDGEIDDGFNIVGQQSPTHSLPESSSPACEKGRGQRGVVQSDNPADEYDDNDRCSPNFLSPLGARYRRRISVQRTVADYAHAGGHRRRSTLGSWSSFHLSSRGSFSSCASDYFNLSDMAPEATQLIMAKRAINDDALQAMRKRRAVSVDHLDAGWQLQLLPGTDQIRNTADLLGQPEGKLDSFCLTTALRLLNAEPENTHIVAADYATYDSTRGVHVFAQNWKDGCSDANGACFFMLPIQFTQEEHWVLAIIEVEISHISVYDPCHDADPERFDDAVTTTLAFLDQLRQAGRKLPKNKQWIRDRSSFSFQQQVSDTCNSAVFCLAAALEWANGAAIASFDPVACRRVLREAFLSLATGTASTGAETETHPTTDLPTTGELRITSMEQATELHARLFKMSQSGQDGTGLGIFNEVSLDDDTLTLGPVCGTTPLRNTHAALQNLYISLAGLEQTSGQHGERGEIASRLRNTLLRELVALRSVEFRSSVRQSVARVEKRLQADRAARAPLRDALVRFHSGMLDTLKALEC
ncbi:hypothetical protein EJ03DRAFT_331877 [Teratosphaeria nubilosa]|uniref:Ubiquitin-like protease family profile domain-containing protein n=1 Tax=Teratosphaeria nubilosa TaxID=161662 RepID=A0A6G1KUQ2_9PEZI|nr:hypothetical protein EJ03DRAFT_331877 [Teratosphaeria nubilosa]